jgi:hypothetical protein
MEMADTISDLIEEIAYATHYFVLGIYQNGETMETADND